MTTQQTSEDPAAGPEAPAAEKASRPVAAGKKVPAAKGRAALLDRVRERSQAASQAQLASLPPLSSVPDLTLVTTAPDHAPVLEPPLLEDSAAALTATPETAGSAEPADAGDTAEVTTEPEGSALPVLPAADTLTTTGPPDTAAAGADPADVVPQSTPAAPTRTVRTRGRTPQLLSPEPGPDVLLAKRTLELPAAIVVATFVWSRTVKEQTGKRGVVSWLVDDALSDLPVDVDKLRALAGRLPAPLIQAPPEQLGLKLRASTVELLSDVLLELRVSRVKKMPMWHVTAGALYAHLTAIGVPVDGS